MDDVVELVLTPFKDVVEKGRVAANNAGDSQPMLKAALALVKEGERALKRIEPLCKKHLDEYGSGFVDALKENDALSNYRTELTDLLWEFDDYVEAENFDADKYTELQGVSRKVAPRVYDILMRMKLEVPAQGTANLFMSQLSPPSSPHSMHPNSLLNTPRDISSQTGSVTDINTVEDANNHLQRLMSNQTARSRDGSMDALGLRRSPAPPEQPPNPPSSNPWDPRTATLSDDGRSEYSPVERRPMLLRPESPVDPAISPLSPARDHGNVRRTGSNASDYESDDRRQSSSSSAYSSGSFFGHSSRTRSSNITMPIPEEELVEHSVKPLPQVPPCSGHQRTAAGTAYSRKLCYAGGTAAQPLSPGNAPSDLEVSSPVAPIREIDNGLIPVETQSTTRGSDMHAPGHDCTIGASASFYHHKGFCEGAKEVIRGDVGVKKTQKPVRRTLSRVVARCTGCLYELDFAQVEIDVNMQEEGNFTKCDVGYRLRFLQKSHLPAKRVDDVLYACLFCIHEGRTLDESDATVFFTTRALFSHLARHPRPLPVVPGITVVETPDMPPQLRNNYDLHFPQPPAPHPAKEHSAEITGLPTGVAKEQARRIYGQRLLYDRTEALELAQGARISGIKWPPKYNGEWIFAWHDGVFASVPTDVIKLDRPLSSEIKMGEQATKGDWLKFDKNEIITNISWSHPDHWCWSGTNAKGKWGIFPQAFIDPNTVSQDQAASEHHSDRASLLSHERPRTAGILSKFSTRRPSS
ncbi:hypothetical protein ACCO45_011402 [Purpureocillium lilacinum]|uniref:Uncharacterized protein n=1 Tax=Purpureocillium lilacinum TaxID=33203 RepID=A0ACC4DAP9_PURLI